MLEFREPREPCLGYTAKGTSGSGSGGKLGRLMAQAIVAAINRGLDHPKHFEELRILQKRRDRPAPPRRRRRHSRRHQRGGGARPRYGRPLNRQGRPGRPTGDARARWARRPDGELATSALPPLPKIPLFCCVNRRPSVDQGRHRFRVSRETVVTRPSRFDPSSSSVAEATTRCCARQPSGR